jgi:hypothetical protein
VEVKPVRIGAVFLALALVTAGVAMALWGRSIPQPIAFSHQKHVQELGMDCVDCHLYALTGERATIPNIKVCSECHEEVLTESAEEARVVEHVQQGESIAWRKIYRVPQHVYFSHRRHTAIAQIECEVCHGEIGQLTESLTRPLRSLSMNHCMECHDEVEASNDCVACHR